MGREAQGLGEEELEHLAGPAGRMVDENLSFGPSHYLFPMNFDYCPGSLD